MKILLFEFTQNNSYLFAGKRECRSERNLHIPRGRSSIPQYGSSLYFDQLLVLLKRSKCTWCHVNPKKTLLRLHSVFFSSTFFYSILLQLACIWAAWWSVCILQKSSTRLLLSHVVQKNAGSICLRCIVFFIKSFTNESRCILCSLSLKKYWFFVIDVYR